jgi:hypothetical protein
MGLWQELTFLGTPSRLLLDLHHLKAKPCNLLISDSSQTAKEHQARLPYS